MLWISLCLSYKAQKTWIQIDIWLRKFLRKKSSNKSTTHVCFEKMGHRSCFKDTTDQIYPIYACTDTNHVRHFTASHRFMVHFVVAGSKGFPPSIIFFFNFPNLKGIIYVTKLCNKKYRSLWSFKSWKSSYLFTWSIE